MAQALFGFKSLLHPLGSAIPVSLVRDIPFDQDAAVLLLGRGSPKDILYTVYLDQRNAVSCKFWIRIQWTTLKADPYPASRKLDFTCCDVEPAILGTESTYTLFF